MITWRRTGALVVAAGLLLTSCTSGSEGNSVSQSFLPSATRSDPGPVRHDPEPLTKRFPGLGEPVSVTWQSGTDGRSRRTGTEHLLDRRGRPAAAGGDAVAAGHRRTDRHRGAGPADAVRAAVPDGPWRTADALATTFASPGFGTQA
jgi:hypothetical protein